MKMVQKTLKPRLPKEAREKLAKGGRHNNRKDVRRKPKHPHMETL